MYWNHYSEKKIQQQFKNHASKFGLFFFYILEAKNQNICSSMFIRKLMEINRIAFVNF